MSLSLAEPRMTTWKSSHLNTVRRIEAEEGEMLLLAPWSGVFGSPYIQSRGTSGVARILKRWFPYPNFKIILIFITYACNCLLERSAALAHLRHLWSTTISFHFISSSLFFFLAVVVYCAETDWRNGVLCCNSYNLIVTTHLVNETSDADEPDTVLCNEQCCRYNTQYASLS